jgi:signal transduction histidine kinase
VTALGKLFRTTAFKLALVFLVIFAIFAALILGYVALNARRLLDEQVSATVSEEMKGLFAQFNAGGIQRLVRFVERRSAQPGSSLYLVTTAAGETLAGNIASVDGDILLEAGGYELSYHVIEDGVAHPRHAYVESVALPGGFHLVVGRDLDEADRLHLVILRAAGWSILFVLLLAVIAGLFVARRVLSRVDQMTETSRVIMAGDFSGRLAVTGTNDELDRLAQSLNAMLERISELMAGLREVSDNIAHDLKTPLTRLRNSAEEALRTGSSPDDYRVALNDVIDEADGLIKVFNALLMIARADAGGHLEGMAIVDAGDIARDVAELYEPLAEEAGLALRVEVDETLPIKASRELIGQALANLLDNAIKYTAETDGEHGPCDVHVTAQKVGDRIELAVADRGPGIPLADRGRAIERFVRLETSRTRPGSGLGLSLAAAVARLHGGTLRLEDHAPGLKAVLDIPSEPS